MTVTVWDRIWNSRKALWATFAAGWATFAALVAALPPGAGVNSISLQGWLAVGTTVVAAGGGTYFLTNKPLPVVTADVLPVIVPDPIVPDTITPPDISVASVDISGGPEILPDLSVPTVGVLAS